MGKTMRRQKTYSRQTVAQTAKKVDRLAKIVKAPEVKFCTVSGSFTTLQQSAPFIKCINPLAEGTSELNNRIGDKVRFKSIDMRIEFNNISGTPVQNNVTAVRLMLVKESTALGSDVALAQLLGSATPNTFTPFNVSTRDHRRWSIVYDKVYTLAAISVANCGDKARWDLHINPKIDFQTDYSRGTAGDITDIEKNSFSLILITDSSIASAIAVNYSSIMGYTDN